MFSSIRSFFVVAVCLLALGVMAAPSVVLAAPAAEKAYAPDSATANDPGAGVTAPPTFDLGGAAVARHTPSWATSRPTADSRSPAASGSPAASYSSSNDDCEVEERRLNTSILMCLVTSAIPLGKILKVGKGVAKGAKAGKGAKGTKGTKGDDDIPKDATDGDGFSLGEALLGGIAALVCWDVVESYWALEHCLADLGC